MDGAYVVLIMLFLDVDVDADADACYLSVFSLWRAILFKKMLITHK